MKFGEKFSVYLETNQERFVKNFRHVEYKRLKKVLKRCRSCRAINDSPSVDDNGDEAAFSHNKADLIVIHKLELLEKIKWRVANVQDLINEVLVIIDRWNTPFCDQKFFSELMKEATDIAGCFSSRIHSSANGSKFKSKLRAEHTEILQSPWLMELGAFCKNFNERRGDTGGLHNPFLFDLTASAPTITLILPDNVKLEYQSNLCNLLVFNPYALSYGHIFCKSCACSAASVMVFQGLKAANSESKCPVCREVGVYTKAVHMMELDLLLKKECKEYWKERLVTERADMVKQTKVYWETQTEYMIGY
ncbi:hypothetical protein SASPL_138504 [Salvia splendens]|uniref:RING-type E3 ubiquitin transferase n=1 Tax=Salvia splendens TaxID=180675 RepID=A0A8X8WTN4_SALSN|nr:hypothetical protein SASPL_138504 [Salvia splendens]